MSKLPVVTVGVVCGLVLLYWSLTYRHPTMWISAAVAFIVAIVATWQVVAMLHRRSVRSRHAAGSGEEAAWRQRLGQ
jgi:uncharacterized membrane protein YoaK (UPF0700 family)